MRRLPVLALAALLAACPWPVGLPEVAPPGRAPSGAVYPDLRADLGAPQNHRRDAAIIVSIADYTHMTDRPGAHAMAAAWYGYFRETRRMRPWRIKLLRDSEATRESIAEAIDEARWWVDHRSTLWLVVVGHISGEPGSYGALWLPAGDGTAATATTGTAALPDILARIDRGHHPRAVAVFDGCMPPGLSPAGTDTPSLPLRPIPESKGLVQFAPARDLWTLLSQTEYQTRADVDRSRNMPADLALFSAGHGDGCVARLPGTDFPALSYLVLGGLRGWADDDRDGDVTAVEAITSAHDTLQKAAPGTPARPSLFTADMVLARDVSERPPDLRLTPGAQDIPVAGPAPPPRIVLDDMVRIDRSAFRMGCPSRRDPECEKDERPSNRVVVSRFFIDPREATVADYARCVARGQCSKIDPSRCFVWDGSAFIKGGALPELLTRPDHPIVCINWHQAARYCGSLGKHLPTEAEWERTAAGTTRRRFPWGDEPPTCARAHHDGCGEHTRPVGSHPEGATPEGVHDLSGNVAEWVYDWYAKSIYWDFRKADPVGPLRGEVRVVRGGSFYEGPSTLRNAYRYGLNPDSGFSTVGVRCSR